MSDPESPDIPISLVAHTVFCARRAWIEASGERVDSAQIESGLHAHARVDSAVSGAVISRSVEISHEELGLVGKCDVVESGGSGPGTAIVEYKATPVRRVPEVTRANTVQLALQRLCLESVGTPVDDQRVYFTNHHQSVQVPLAAEDFDEAREWVARTREIITADDAPKPLIDDPRCRFCSHVSVCLPDENVAAQLQHVRRIAVGDPAGEVLHLTTPGSRASIKAGRVVVQKAREEVTSVPIERVVGLVVHGNVDVSSALTREILWRGYGIVWCSGGGRVVGHARSARSPNGFPRMLQHLRAYFGDLALCRELISSKVANQATQLRRGTRADVKAEVARMRVASRSIQEATTIPEIFGLEGEAAAIYFEYFPTMVSDAADQGFLDRWEGRTGRGARDPLNVALNYSYGLLLADCIRAIHAAGLDPHAGFVHSSLRNKPAFALDLMEQFRPLIADSAVLTAVNNGQLATTDFSFVSGATRLGPSGRKVLTAEYERRVAQEFTHPVFKYKVSWRRSIEVQARMVLALLDGTRDSYIGIRTR